MARAEPGSAKYIANKIKAKGLQRLRWYCQICEKQCRDENGFKCHAQSPGHVKNALKLKDNASSTIENYSKKFQAEFIYLLRTSHGTKPINANKFYGEYIQDKDHTHMNATKWTSLGGFLRFLERKGLVELSEDELGLVVCYKGQKQDELAEQEPRPRENQVELQMARAKQQERVEQSLQAGEPRPEPQQQAAPPLESGPVSFTLPKSKKRRTNTKMAPF